MSKDDEEVLQLYFKLCLFELAYLRSVYQSVIATGGFEEMLEDLNKEFKKVYECLPVGYANEG